MTDLYRQQPATAPPSLTDLVVIYPRAGLTPGALDSDDAARLRALRNPEQITTLQALADAVRPAAASTASAGLVELATVEQARAGLDNQRAVTSAGVAAAITQGLTGGVALSLTSLNDTPSALGSAGQFLRVNTARDSLEWTDAALPTGAQIVNALRALSGNARLPATAIRDLPAGSLADLTDVPSTTGTAGQVLAVNSTRTGFVYVDAPTSGGGGGALTAVQSDATLTGDGTLASVLRVANPFTAAEKAKLGRVADGAEVNVQADWNATSGDAAILNKPVIPAPETAIAIRNKLETLGGNDRLPASAIMGLTTGATAFTGLSDTPGTLSGQGGKLLRVDSQGNSLGFVDFPAVITSSERNKLTAIEAQATADQTGAEIRDRLARLSGAERLPDTAIVDGRKILLSETYYSSRTDYVGGLFNFNNFKATPFPLDRVLYVRCVATFRIHATLNRALEFFFITQVRRMYGTTTAAAAATAAATAAAAGAAAAGLVTQNDIFISASVRMQVPTTEGAQNWEMRVLTSTTDANGTTRADHTAIALLDAREIQFV